VAGQPARDPDRLGAARAGDLRVVHQGRRRGRGAGRLPALRQLAHRGPDPREPGTGGRGAGAPSRHVRRLGAGRGLGRRAQGLRRAAAERRVLARAVPPRG
jgi:hypothetical protein